eukprot:m.34043 g.34043  ORF g.34043 m.34043 type:complete len:80 (+) comp12270_c0_seq1:767-1006(+)
MPLKKLESRRASCTLCNLSIELLHKSSCCGLNIKISKKSYKHCLDNIFDHHVNGMKGVFSARNLFRKLSNDWMSAGKER